MNGEVKADGWLDRLLREKPVVKVDEFPEEVVCVTGDGDGVEWRVYSPKWIRRRMKPSDSEKDGREGMSNGNLAAKELEHLRDVLEPCRRTEVAGFDSYWILADALDACLDELAEAIADEREPDAKSLMELAESLKAENAELRAKLASIREAVG